MGLKAPPEPYNRMVRTVPMNLQNNHPRTPRQEYKLPILLTFYWRMRLWAVTIYTVDTIKTRWMP